MRDGLEKELETRGTAEVGPTGVVNQVTQALGESPTEVEFLIFGEKRKQTIIPIEQACAKCNFWKDKFATTTECQKFQGKEGAARGFHKLICPRQFD